MSKQTQAMMKGKPPPNGYKNNGPSSGKPPQKPLSPQESKDLGTLRSEAKKAGSFLATGGKGGLSPTLVLQTMRRDRFTCKRCGAKGTKENGLTIHEKGGIPASPELSAKGHTHTLDNMVSICENCHDKIHVQARKLGVDSTQVLPKADKGTKHDHGQPVAKNIPSGKSVLKFEQKGKSKP